MYLKRLQLYGFKTFADKTEIEFAPGFMSVVGPNGSGKSNLTDAVRYCLGEQNAKVLRATKQDELIFAGTPARHGAPFAQVTAVFDNEDGHINVDFAEVSITRRISRQGDSDYFINDIPCRLRDIHELLLGSGVGPGSFSVLGGKEVDMVLSSDPKDRRNMLEETAGTNRYRFRKKEAARKLQQTAQNVLRLRDILTEVEQNTQESWQAVERCQKYKEAQSRLKDLDSRLITRDFRTWQEKLQKGERSQAELQKQYEEAEQKSQSLGSQLEQAQGERDNLQHEVEQVLNEQGEVKSELSSAQASYEALFRQAGQLENSARAADQRIFSAKERLQKRQEELDALRSDLPGRQEVLVKAQAECRRWEAELKAQGDTFSAPLETLRRQAAEQENRIKSLQGSLAAQKARNEVAESQWLHLQEQIEALEKEMRGASAEGGKADGPVISEEELDKLKADLQALEVREQELLEKQKHYNGEISTAKSSRFNLEKQRRPLSTRVMELEALVEERVGMPPALRAVLSWKDSGTVGAISELITVKEGLETALEAALGGRLNDVVTRDRHAASRLIERLKRERIGRVTFWPLDLERRDSDPISLPTQHGVVGQALDLISFDPSLRSVLNQMLGQTVVMRDLASALALYDKCRGRRPHLVTLEGEYLSPTGAVTGGVTRNSAGGMLAKKRALDQAVENLHSLDRQISNLVLQENNAQTNLDTIRTDLEQASLEVRQGRGRVSWAQDELRASQREAERCRKQLADWHAQADKQEQALIQGQEKCRQEGRALEVAQAAWGELNGRIESIREQAARENAEREQLRQRYGEAETQRLNAERDIKEIQRRIDEAEGRCLEIMEDQHQFEQELLSSREARQALEFEGQDLNLAIAEAKRRGDELKEQLEKKSARLKDLDGHIRTLRNSHFEASQRSRTANDKLHSWEVQRESLHANLENARQHLLHLGFDIQETPLPEVEPGFDVGKAQAQVRQLRSFLENFGSVNLSALEDYERLKTRRDDLNAQITDLEEASANFKNIIAEMDKASITCFQEVFAQVNVTFNKLFGEIFGGGWAKLELSDPEDILESGVDIHACPPGKKLQNLALFSSGERALAAMAFLLALLTHKPSPIVVLDELDAPLDDTNVERIAQRLKMYSQKSQFLVITHNRKTMEYADRLYGVTMEEPGVSKILSVEMK